MDFIASSEEETKDFARKLARRVNSPALICLHGDLGAGKSVFARAFIRELLGDECAEVPSPTFTLLQSYDSPKGPLWHFDLYRIADPSEIYELGWEEAMASGIAVLEWPSKAGNLLPEERINVTIAPLSGEQNARRITIEGLKDHE